MIKKLFKDIVRKGQSIIDQKLDNFLNEKIKVDPVSPPEYIHPRLTGDINDSSFYVDNDWKEAYLKLKKQVEELEKQNKEKLSENEIILSVISTVHKDSLGRLYTVFGYSIEEKDKTPQAYVSRLKVNNYAKGILLGMKAAFNQLALYLMDNKTLVIKSNSAVPYETIFGKDAPWLISDENLSLSMMIRNMSDAFPKIDIQETSDLPVIQEAVNNYCEGMSKLVQEIEKCSPHVASESSPKTMR